MGVRVPGVHRAEWWFALATTGTIGATEGPRSATRYLKVLQNTTHSIRLLERQLAYTSLTETDDMKNKKRVRYYVNESTKVTKYHKYFPIYSNKLNIPKFIEESNYYIIISLRKEIINKTPLNIV